jgi:S-formylglutathione hydrolase FrmB
MPSFLTRRRFLIGGAVLAAGTGAALAAGDLHPRRWLEAVTGGCGEAGPLPPASPEAPISGSFSSAVLGLEVGYAIAVPPGHRVGDALPVAFMLPGRGGTASATMANTRFADFVAEAVAGGQRPFALAAVDGGSSYWHLRDTGEDRMAMLVEEFIPMCTERFGVGQERRALIGWSMGGYGALLAAGSHPGMFVGVAAASPAIWRSYDEMDDAVGDAFDGPEDFDRFNLFAMTEALGATPVRIDCGTADPFYANDRALAEAISPTPQGEWFTGCHNAASWRVVAPAQVAFLADALSAADGPAR